MKFVNVILLSFCLLNFGYGNTEFVQLLGWKLNADTLLTHETTDANDCGTECVLTPNCTGFRMVHGTGICNLLTIVRSVTFESNQCQYYLKKFTNVTVVGRSLDGIDAMIQNAVYASQSACPNGWTVENSICTLNVDETTCNEYASFLNITWDGTSCVAPKMNVTYKCASSSYTARNYPDGSYCYRVFPRWSGVVGNSTYYDMSNTYCNTLTKGYLASIHSETENNDINALQNALNATDKGMMIGLVSTTSTVTSTDNFYWLDGTGVYYSNIEAAGTGSQFLFTLMTASTGKWSTTSTDQNSFKYLVCKVSAKVTMAPM